MSTRAPAAALLALAFSARAAQTPQDLTRADKKAFEDHLGQIVSLRGTLKPGKEGKYLSGATPEDVNFYVIPKMPPSGAFSWPKSWTRLANQKVRITGRLKFHVFPRVPGGNTLPAPRDYYFFVQQDARIEPLYSK